MFQRQLSGSTQVRKEIRMKLRKAAITTKDNPYDPFDQFTQWFLYDVERGYNTCAYLGRIARTSDALSTQENDRVIEQAIDEIIKYDPFDIYVKRIRFIDEPDDIVEED